MKNHKAARDRAAIIQRRIEGSQFGDSLPWEELRLHQYFTSDYSYIYIVSGDEDLAASLIADIKAEIHDSDIGEDFYLIEIAVE
jgi:hypothetical protein